MKAEALCLRVAWFAWSLVAMLIQPLAHVQAGQTAKDHLSQLKARGVLKIAVDTTYPPMEFQGDDGKPAGFDIDLGRKLAAELGVKAQFVVMPWEGILVGLHSGRYDVILSSMNITPERSQRVDFVPYLAFSQVLVSKKTQPVASQKELAGLRVAVQADTTSHQAIEAMVKSGLKVASLKAFKGATDAFAALRARQADVVVIDEPVGRYYTKLDKNLLVSGQLGKAEPVGLALNKGQPKLKQALDKAMATLKKSGVIQQLKNTWFGPES